MFALHVHSISIWGLIANLDLLLFVFPAFALVFFSLCVCVVLSRKNVKASAVCRFTLSDVQEAFQGPYMESHDSGSEWKEYTGKIPEPRPGTVKTYVLLPARRSAASIHSSSSSHQKYDPNHRSIKRASRGKDGGK